MDVLQRLYQTYITTHKVVAYTTYREPADSILEDYSAFANADGGLILIGAQLDEGNALQVLRRENIENLAGEIRLKLYDSHSMSASLLIADDVFICHDGHGEKFIAIEVPRAPLSLRPVFINGKPDEVYRRNSEGKYLCSASEIDAMKRDSLPQSMDSTPVSGSSIDDLNKTTVDAFRATHSSLMPNHPWLSLSDSHYLIDIGAAVKTDDGIVLTVAGLLMFGKQDCILKQYPGVLLEYKEYKEDSDELAFRRSSNGAECEFQNLFSFYEFCFQRLQKIVDDNTQLNAGQKEFILKVLDGMLCNSLENSDYCRTPCVELTVRSNHVVISNAGDVRVGKESMLAGGVSNTRNRGIKDMMALVCVSERLSVSTMVQYWQNAGLNNPLVFENCSKGQTSFILPLLKAENFFLGGGKLSVYQRRAKSILVALSQEPSMKADDIAGAIGLSSARTRAILAQMAADGYVISEGATKGRRYQIAPGVNIERLSPLQ